MQFWSNKKLLNSKLHLQLSNRQKYSPQIYQMQHRIHNNQLLQLHKNLNHRHRIKQLVNNSQIIKTQTVILILRIVQVQMETPVLLLAIAHQEILRHPTLLIRHRLPLLIGSCKMSRIYKTIL
jgi:hypothetical protein